MIYFDHAATTKMSEASLQVFMDASREFFANSESLHDAGTKSAALLENAGKVFLSYYKFQTAGFYLRVVEQRVIKLPSKR